MAHSFDPGPVRDPFASLARDYPGPETYPPDRFRVEWGPIFHRGRLDGSAELLVLGQDPGQHESIARRNFVGEAGQRVQGFVAKLGIEPRYVMINAFLYSVYRQPGPGDLADVEEAIASERGRWLDALLGEGGQIRAVVAFGAWAARMFEGWKKENQAALTDDILFVHVAHPTMPDAVGRNDPERKATAMREMLEKWNQALERLDRHLGTRGPDRELEHYGDALTAEDLAPIPEEDLPAGSPPWMRSLENWAVRQGSDEESRRATVVVTIPEDERPWRR